MPAKIFSATNVGLDCEIIEVEVDLSHGLSKFTVVGLGDTAIQESRERVRSAIRNSELAFHTQRITVNLAPADLAKSGPSYDLPIAVGILLASRQLEFPEIQKSIVIGELALDGSTRGVAGILPIVSEAAARGFENFFVPTENAAEAAIVAGVKIFPIENLQQLVEHGRGNLITPLPPTDASKILRHENFGIDLAEVRGQEHAKRALTVAAAGGHNLLMNGPPGSGKTMLAKALRTILPKLSLDEALDVTKIYSVAGLLSADEPLVSARPYRAVHHTASAVAIVGGGRKLNPGEISLAHRGVLFFDEIAEFPSAVLEVLRQPLEDGEITISRAAGSLKYPARFTLVAAMNPCPCGFATDPDRACRCSPAEITRYQKKLSGPLLDRIDMHLEVPRVKFGKLAAPTDEANSSTAIREKVEAVRKIQAERFAGLSIATNSEMSSNQTKKFCRLPDDAAALLQQAVTHFQLSTRAYFRVLKLSRTIADLAGREEIVAADIAEALQYRPRVEVN